ncbi:MAG: hypothetical protein WC947_05345 [Elusimicrobiota bacterium]
MKKIILMMVISLNISLNWQAVWGQSAPTNSTTPAKADMQGGQDKNAKSTISTPSPNTRAQMIEHRKLTLREIANELSSELEIPICSEIFPTKKGEQEQKKYFYPDKKVIQEKLHNLMKQDKDYYMEEEQGIFNIIPVAYKNDKNYPLNRKIKKITIKNLSFLELISKIRELTNMSIGEFGFAVGMSAPSLEAIEERMRPYKKEYVTIGTLKNVTVRQVMNSFVRKKKNCHWIYFGTEGFRIIYLEPWPISREKKLQEFLITHPEADQNKDRILTEEERSQYLK